jgi:hypothetical protein
LPTGVTVAQPQKSFHFKIKPKNKPRLSSFKRGLFLFASLDLQKLEALKLFFFGLETVVLE